MATKVPRRDGIRTDGGAAIDVRAAPALRPASGRIGTYALKYELGSGATSTVYLAQRVDSQSIVQWSALKVLRPELARRADATDGFLEQARKAIAVRHPYLSPPLDIGTADGTPYIASEFLVAEPFTRIQSLLVGQHAEVAVPYVAELIARAAEGLHAAHGATDERGAALSLVHRNASPHNLFAVQDGTVRVVDFGCSPPAKLRGAQRTDDAARAAYMAPELLKTRGVDQRSDVWSLGVVLWEMLAGRALFRKTSEVRVVVAVLEETIELPSRFNAAVPSALDVVVMRALQRDRELRFQSAEHFAHELRTASTLSFGSISTRALADWVNTLFAASLDVRRQLIGAKAPPLLHAAAPGTSARTSTARKFSGKATDPAEAAVLEAATRAYSQMPANDVSSPVFTFGLISEVEFSPQTIVADAVAPHAEPGSDAPPRHNLAGVLEPDAHDTSLHAQLHGGPRIARQVAIAAVGLLALVVAGAFAGALWHGEPSAAPSAGVDLPQAPSLAAPPVGKHRAAARVETPATGAPDAPVAAASEAAAAPTVPTEKTAAKARPAPASPSLRGRSAGSGQRVVRDTADDANTGEVYVAAQARDIYVSYRGGREVAVPGKLRLPAGTQTITVRHADSAQREERTVTVFAGALVMMSIR